MILITEASSTKRFRLARVRTAQSRPHNSTHVYHRRL